MLYRVGLVFFFQFVSVWMRSNQIIYYNSSAKLRSRHPAATPPNQPNPSPCEPFGHRRRVPCLGRPRTQAWEEASKGQQLCKPRWGLRGRARTHPTRLLQPNAAPHQPAATACGSRSKPGQPLLYLGFFCPSLLPGTANISQTTSILQAIRTLSGRKTEAEQL